MATLGPAGQALLVPLLATYAFSRPEGTVLIEAGHAADRLEELRDARRACALPQRLKLNVAERQASQHLVSLLRELFDR